ncbi:hypothetical protein ACF0H5_001059 [Mactra antiquata]
MKGVDLLDQMIGNYMPNHRSRKWWRRLFHHFQMTTAYNAYVLAKESNPNVVQREWPQFQDFLEDLAEDLIGDYSSSRDTPLINLTNQPVLPPSRHKLITKMFEKRKTCKDCRKRNPGARPTQTFQGCETCCVPVCVKCVECHMQRDIV